MYCAVSVLASLFLVGVNIHAHLLLKQYTLATAGGEGLAQIG